MQMLSRLTFPVIALLLTTASGKADEEHLMVDRTGETVFHYAENNGPPADAVVTNQPNPWSVAWDADSEAVYWTELGSGAIWRKFLNTGTIEQVYYSSNSVLRGLTLDLPNNRLFFLDSNNGTLNEFNLLTSNKITRVGALIRPNDMVLDRANNKLYFTDSGNDFVGCYNLNIPGVIYPLKGSNVVDGVWGIAVVPETDSLYISDHRTNAIMRADLDGSNLQILVPNQETPRGLFIDRHHERIYWLEASTSNLLSSTLEGFNVQVVLTNAAVSPRDLASYHSLDQDNDFLNDSWERSYFGHLREGAYGDPDGDGVDTFTEHAFGLNPTNFNETGTGTLLSYVDGTGPSLKYYFRTDGWLKYEMLHSADLHAWHSISNFTETGYSPDISGGATRTILMDELANMFGDEQFFKVETRR